jgi:hypothetical protein
MQHFGSGSSDKIGRRKVVLAGAMGQRIRLHFIANKCYKLGYIS